MRALEMIAPGTALREGIESILHARTGGLIVIGEPEDLSFLNSGGIKLEIDYTPAFLYQVAKMDGAIVLDDSMTRVVRAALLTSACRFSACVTLPGLPDSFCQRV